MTVLAASKISSLPALRSPAALIETPGFAIALPIACIAAPIVLGLNWTGVPVCVSEVAMIPPLLVCVRLIRFLRRTTVVTTLWRSVTLLLVKKLVLHTENENLSARRFDARKIDV